MGKKHADQSPDTQAQHHQNQEIILKASFFYEKHSSKVAKQIKQHINSSQNFLSDITATSPRAVGDTIEKIVATGFEDCIGNWCKEYSPSFARRAMADFAFHDKEGFYCIVDVKTHRADTDFNMPALTSVQRLARFYEDDSNVFSIMMVKYAITDNQVKALSVHFSPIEFLDWRCLTVGALGWGQIQIIDSNNLVFNHGCSRKTWMLTLCEKMLEFYPKEILKIQDRMGRFNEVKTYWETKEDLWKK